MRQEMLHDALDLIDDDLIEAVGKLRAQKKNRRRFIRYASIAACACIAVGGIMLWRMDHWIVPEGVDGSDGIGNDQEKYSAGGVLIPEAGVSTDGSSISDMLAFFIYDGRVYVEYEVVAKKNDLVGDYLGDVEGTIEEWTAEDGYVDYAGSTSGAFYTVKGYDPKFMLCKISDDGSVAIYINDNGLSLEKGRDLFEEKLHLSDNYVSMEYQTRGDWYKGLGNIKTFTEEMITSERLGSGDKNTDVLKRFVAALGDGDFMYTSDVPLDDGEKNIYDREMYHLFFRMGNGMTTHIRLYKGGYARFEGLISVCVKVDERAFNALVDAFE